MKQSNQPAPLSAYMGQAKEKGGAPGWIPVHPAVIQAITPHLRNGDKNLACWCAMFLAACWRLRGTSTVVGEGWIEKTRADWMATLGTSKRTADFVIATMCHDDATGNLLTVNGLGLVRRRVGGFRNSAQYQINDLRAANFWLNNGPQLALGGGQAQLESGDDDAGEVGPLVGGQVGPLVGRQVGPTKGRQVGPLVGQPHKNASKTCTKTNSNSGRADDDLYKVLALYGFTDKGVISQAVGHLAGRSDSTLQVYFYGEMSLAEQVHREDTPAAIRNVVGWTWRKLQNVDDHTPVMSWETAQAQLAAAQADMDAHPIRQGRNVPDYEGIAARKQAQAQRLAIVKQIVGAPADPPADHSDDDARTAKTLAERERWRKRRQTE